MTGDRRQLTVRFTPKATEVLRRRKMTRCARTDKVHRGKNAGYSITSSERASREGDMLSPSALAVLRFTAILNRVGN